MPTWLIALLAYLAVALPSALLLVAALFAGAASEATTSASPAVRRLPRSLEPAPVDRV
jgi:chromate transport protein ChrA